MIYVTDLQIGDWVMTPYGPYQVDTIYDNGTVSAGLIELAFTELNGIPITAEIMEKNGFESDTNMFGLCDYKLSESYILENRGDRFCFVKRIPSYSSSTFHMFDVKYAHEFQHTLRLCGIDKTIVL